MGEYSDSVRAQTAAGHELCCEEEKNAFRNKLERLLSEILSDQYDCKITLKFVAI